MFAVVETGGKQYKVSPGQTVEVEKLPAEPGDTVELGRVLLISTDDETFVGAPLVEDAKVVARVAPERRGPKIIVFRYKSKARYRRKTGHRQDYSVLTIEDIWANGASLLPIVEEAEAEPEEEETVTAAEEEDVTEAKAETEETAVSEAEVVEVEEADAAPPAAPEKPRRGRRRTPKADAEKEE
ncbi:MAG TPA: 50S ribosomal protein L21 [Ktedonobacterales bacterium]|jgi:large subunit ribosomal protein L21